MRSERRSSSNPDRRQSQVIRRQHDELVVREKKSSARSEPILTLTSDAFSKPRKETSLREEAVQLREERASLREYAILADQRKIDVREDAVYEREMHLLHREGFAAKREQKIRDVQRLNCSQEDANFQLRQANERLVVTSVQLQIMTEELERSKTELIHLATHDHLTDLPNRMQLYDRIGQAIALARRHKTTLALLFLDLDRFKIVNDTLGHAVGDKLLQLVAQRLKSAIRGSDSVNRHGGDEFVLLLSEVSEGETLALQIEKIHSIITAPYCIDGNDINIGATIGVSIFPQDGEDGETLIRNADAAMYQYKQNGRNKI